MGRQSERYVIQRINWVKETGIVDHAFINSTTLKPDGGIERYTTEQALVSSGTVADLTSGSVSSTGTSDSPFFYSFSLIALITAVYFKRR